MVPPKTRVLADSTSRQPGTATTSPFSLKQSPARVPPACPIAVQPRKSPTEGQTRCKETSSFGSAPPKSRTLSNGVAFGRTAASASFTSWGNPPRYAFSDEELCGAGNGNSVPLLIEAPRQPKPLAFVTPLLKVDEDEAGCQRISRRQRTTEPKRLPQILERPEKGSKLQVRVGSADSE
jgi:hypothetical protein